MNKVYDLERDNLKIIMFKYLSPSIVSLVLAAIYIIIDGIFVGRGTGQEGLAAINIGYPIINFANALSLMFGIGGSILMSIYSKKYRIKNLFFSYIIMLCILSYLLINIFVFILGDRLIFFMGSSQSLLVPVKEYLYPISVGLIFIMLATALSPVLRNNHAPLYAFMCMIAGALTNIFLDWLFIMKFHWGLRGAAVATVIGQFIAFLSMTTYFFSSRNHLKLNFRKIKLNIIFKILSLGFSSFIVEFAVAIILVVFNIKFMEYGGEIAVSAFCIVAYIFCIFRMCYTGVAQGIQPIVSYNYGVKNFKRAKNCFYLAHKINLTIAFIAFILVNIFAKEIIEFFNRDLELVKMTMHGLRIYIFALFFLGPNLVNINYLQAKNKARSAISITIMSSFVYLTFFIIILPKIFGLDGIWMAFPVSDCMTLLSTFLLRKKINLI